jgi:hypothetical protein
MSRTDILATLTAAATIPIWPFSTSPLPSVTHVCSTTFLFFFFFISFCLCFAHGASAGTANMCLTATETLSVSACAPSTNHLTWSHQQWNLTTGGNLRPASGGCADVYNFTGPDITITGGCKAHSPGFRGSQNDEWT